LAEQFVSQRLRVHISTWREIVKVSNSLGEFPEQFVRQAINERLARTGSIEEKPRLEEAQSLRT
jgi:hypothetical protein